MVTVSISMHNQAAVLVTDPGAPLDWPVTVALGEPTDGVGTSCWTPFIDTASSESFAKPTEGGDAFRTVYTFFCNQCRQRAMSPWAASGDVPGTCRR